MKNICPWCKQSRPVSCIDPNCGARVHYVKSKRSVLGTAYQVQCCEVGHKFVLAHNGAKAWRWSKEIDVQGLPPSGHIRPLAPRLTNRTDERA